ncbi:MAG: DUF192 domain-containing protein [Planctomycetes bacterium]|nr:DUF192 domain-containing protein [Planctomycetota bacterium]
MTRKGLIALLLAAGASCTERAEYATVTLKGRSIQVEWRRGEPERREAALRHSRLVDGRGILAGWPVDRVQHYFSTGSKGAFDVLFLSADGRILERQTLPADSEAGITSQVEARYALFLAEGWLKRAEVGDDDRVDLSGVITDLEPPPMPIVQIAGVPLAVEVAATPQERNRGLMHRRAIGAEEGMIFVFPAEQDQNFFMLNCHFALDIAYFDGTGAFINLVPMDPYPKPTVDTGKRAKSAKPARYVIETRKGWFQAKGLVDAGGKALREIRLEIPPAVHAYAKKVGT